MIERKEYYDYVERFIDKPVIKVITGIRRAGKSTMLKLLQMHLESRGIDKDKIIYINFESMKYYNIRTSRTFYDYISDLIKTDQRVYLFLMKYK